MTIIGVPVSANGGGLFVCLEGIDGSGKTTAIATAGGLLRQEGFPVVFFDKKEADFGSSYVERHMTALQKVIWGHPPDDPYLELGDMHWVYLQAAWYSAVATCKVIPLLHSGHLVLTDTWTYKFLAKLKMRPIVNFEHALSAFKQLPRPDLVIRLNIDPAVAAARKNTFSVSESGNREGLVELSANAFTEYQRRLSAVLEEFAEQEGWASVEVSSLSVSQTGHAIAEIVDRHVRSMPSSCVSQ
ncbi:MAG: dTMP kinase [Pseudonocardiales bacterium]